MWVNVNKKKEYVHTNNIQKNGKWYIIKRAGKSELQRGKTNESLDKYMCGRMRKRKLWVGKKVQQLFLFCCKKKRRNGYMYRIHTYIYNAIG